MNRTLEDDSDENNDGEDYGNCYDARDSERENSGKQEDKTYDSAYGCDCSASRCIHIGGIIPKAEGGDEQEDTEQKFDDHGVISFTSYLCGG